MGYILKNDHPEYNSLSEGFAPLRPRLKNERKSDIIGNENGRILRFWRFVYECIIGRGTEVKSIENTLERQGVCQAETVHRGKRSALNVGVYLQFNSCHTDHRVDRRGACTRKGKIQRDC